MANAISVPLTGWLTLRFGAVRLFVMSVLLFVLTSWLCGFAPSLEALVFFRVLQGQGVFGQTLQGLQAAEMSYEQALAQINRLIDQQAFTRAADDVFIASSGIFVVLIALIWLTRRPQPLRGAVPADAGGAH